jgi:cytochrome P450
MCGDYGYRIMGIFVKLIWSSTFAFICPIGLSWFFWLLSCNLHIEDTIHVEITNTLKSKVHVHNKDEKHDPSTLITYEELKEMHYLHAIVTKSLRLYPSVPFDFKMVVKDDVLLDGIGIPNMSYVGYLPYALRRMEQLWG